MILLLAGIAAVLIVLIAVLVGQYLARRDQPQAESYDIHAVLDETGEQVDATVFAARAPKSGLR